MARPIGTKFGICLRIRLGMDMAKYNTPLNTMGGGGISGGLGVTILSLESCQTDGQIGTKYDIRLWIHLGMDIG